VIGLQHERELTEELAPAEDVHLAAAVVEDANRSGEDDVEPVRGRAALEDDAPLPPEQVRRVPDDAEERPVVERLEARDRP